jgi:hypothetical protein
MQSAADASTPHTHQLVTTKPTIANRFGDGSVDAWPRLRLRYEDGLPASAPRHGIVASRSFQGLG